MTDKKRAFTNPTFTFVAGFLAAVVLSQLLGLELSLEMGSGLRPQHTGLTTDRGRYKHRGEKAFALDVTLQFKEAEQAGN